MVNFVKVGTTNELANGERIITEVDDDLWVAIFEINGAYYAIEDVCPHDEGPIGEGEIDGYIIECPRHGQRFDVRDGSRQQLASTGDVPTFEVKVEGTDVFVGVAK